MPERLTDLPFKSHFETVDGHRLHYLDEGEGDPILFLHGMPTWSYLWRNIIPTLKPQGRCIAVDLIGTGKSDKPDIEYTIHEHIAYITQFIERLKLKNVTLVMHGWGSVIGFHYAMQHSENIKGLAFLEAHVRPVESRAMVALPVQQWSSLLENNEGGFDAVMTGNYFINKVLPWGVMRKLSEAEMEHYRAPFEEPGSCRALWQYFQELPLSEDSQSPALKIIQDYSAKLQQSQLPKLMLYALPGFMMPMETVMWARDNFPNITLEEVDEALHYAQESNPEAISAALSKWYESIQ